MASTSARTLKLLSIFGVGTTLTADDLAIRLEVSVRTVRRDIDTLRELGYEIEAVQGVGGGYRLGRSTRLPPVVFDEDQAVAAAVALQVVPAVLSGIRENSAQALATLQQAMPGRSRAQAESLTNITTAPNYWEFPASPIDPEVVRSIGTAINRRHVVRTGYTDAESSARLRLEPHALVVWAARWYMVAFDQDTMEWRVMRVDRLLPVRVTTDLFERREVTESDSVALVMSTHDRGDTPSDWECRGSAVIDLPAALVAQFAPGGSTVEYRTETTSRLRLGAWSWPGLAGLLLTFDADITDIEPAELRQALGSLSGRIKRSFRNEG